MLSLEYGSLYSWFFPSLRGTTRPPMGLHVHVQSQHLRIDVHKYRVIRIQGVTSAVVGGIRKKKTPARQPLTGIRPLASLWSMVAQGAGIPGCGKLTHIDLPASHAKALDCLLPLRQCLKGQIVLDFTGPC
jgi:hypothetical protein